MGFSERGKQYLLPEEALYLMECVSGHLQTIIYITFDVILYHRIPCADFKMNIYWTEASLLDYYKIKY